MATPQKDSLSEGTSREFTLLPSGQPKGNGYITLDSITMGQHLLVGSPGTAEEQGLTELSSACGAALALDLVDIIIGGTVGTNYGISTSRQPIGAAIGDSEAGGTAGCNELEGITDYSMVCVTAIGKLLIGGTVGHNSGVTIGRINAGSTNIEHLEVLSDIDGPIVKTADHTNNKTVVVDDDVINLAINAVIDIGGTVGCLLGTTSISANIGITGHEYAGHNAGGTAGCIDGSALGRANQGCASGCKDAGGTVGQVEFHWESDSLKDITKCSCLESEASCGSADDIIGAAENLIISTLNLPSVTISQTDIVTVVVCQSDDQVSDHGDEAVDETDCVLISSVDISIKSEFATDIGEDVTIKSIDVIGNSKRVTCETVVETSTVLNVSGKISLGSDKASDVVEDGCDGTLVTLEGTKKSPELADIGDDSVVLQVTLITSIGHDLSLVEKKLDKHSKNGTESSKAVNLAVSAPMSGSGTVLVTKVAIVGTGSSCMVLSSLNDSDTVCVIL